MQNAKCKMCNENVNHNHPNIHDLWLDYDFQHYFCYKNQCAHPNSCKILLFWFSLSFILFWYLFVLFCFYWNCNFLETLLWSFTFSIFFVGFFIFIFFLFCKLQYFFTELAKRIYTLCVFVFRSFFSHFFSVCVFGLKLVFVVCTSVWVS